MLTTFHVYLNMFMPNIIFLNQFPNHSVLYNAVTAQISLSLSSAPRPENNEMCAYIWLENICMYKERSLLILRFY